MPDDGVLEEDYRCQRDRPYKCGYCGRMIFYPEQHGPECRGKR